MQTLRVGLIGTGYMGKAHAIAFKMVGTVFPLSAQLVCELVAEVNKVLAQQQAKLLGFNRATGDWRALVRDPDVDIVDICSPNYLHKEMALAAIAAGKHVYTEKPLALNARDALEMTEAAERAGVKTLVGFNYIHNPASQLAKEIITGGEIGEVLHFRGVFNEDFLADPAKPFSWRLQREFSGSGVLGDMGSHLINMAEHLVGEITEVSGDLQTVFKQRPLVDGSGFGTVENDDHMHCLLRFASGAIGTLESSRIAWGRKNGLWYEINGTKGSLIFDQERLSELHLFTASDKASRQGFRTVLMGPQHPDYGQFSPAPGHGLGYNDMKACEVRDLIEGIAANQPLWPDFRAAYQVNRVCDAIERSLAEGCWINVTDC
ncbi:MAG: Gfo/Idh/MocA family oxidoreductase [Candidatus Competibacteraceae bacterium]|nr:Gfo/Idh/MocA family oxidoreductase [Candidatus Competibacteraceae bacterium]MCB1805259.1 Gfo/Idh/MocA family oxidoreductase [Candidatus Competibacteraceae bacterium]MCB1813574.1 Gfo/Idh/MocA family oxidoreductase [Candidatus Competibacteraceae bacterium]